MAKKKKKNVEKRRQKKAVARKKKRSAKLASMKRTTTSKEMKDRDVAQLQKEMKDPLAILMYIDQLTNMIQEKDYFNSVKLDPRKVESAIIPFIDAHIEELDDMAFEDYQTSLKEEVLDKVISYSFKADVSELFDRAIRSPKFEASEKNALMLGHLITSFEQQKAFKEPDELPQDGDLSTYPIWEIFLDLALRELGEKNEKIEEFNEKIKVKRENEFADLQDGFQDQAQQDAYDDEPKSDERIGGPLFDKLEFASKFEKMKRHIEFRFRPDEMFHTMALYPKFRGVPDYLAFADAFEDQKISYETARSYFPMAILQDFSESDTRLRYQNYLEKHSDDPFHHENLMDLKKSTAENHLLINLFLISLFEANEDSHPFMTRILDAPDQIDNYLEFGDHLYKEERYPSAVRAYQRAIEADREDYRGYHAKARGYEALKNWEYSEEHYEIAIDLMNQAKDEGADIPKDVIDKLERDLERVSNM